MARSLLNCAGLLSSVANGVAFSISRRGYSAAAASMARRGRAGLGAVGEERMVVKTMKEEGAESSSSWVPDPVTGFYRPGNRVGEIDAAELRETVLNNQKVRKH